MDSPSEFPEASVPAGRNGDLRPPFAPNHDDDFVNPVGELVAAVLDMDASLTVTCITPIYIGNSWHWNAIRRIRD